jgi:Mycotoxin biosynthesis protein UstYa
MCFPNIGVFGSHWVRNRAHLRPFVDFNTEHVCRNWDDIQLWAKVRQVPADDVIPRDYVKGPNRDTNILDGFP